MSMGQLFLILILILDTEKLTTQRIITTIIRLLNVLAVILFLIEVVNFFLNIETLKTMKLGKKDFLHLKKEQKKILSIYHPFLKTYIRKLL